MKPKLLKPLNHKEICKSLVAKIRKASPGLHWGEVLVDLNLGIVTLIIECSEDISLQMQDVIHNHPNCTRWAIRHTKGSFDWASDTYIKDCTEATFALIP